MMDQPFKTTGHADRAELQRLIGFLRHDPDNLTLRADVFDLALKCGELSIAQKQAFFVLSQTPVNFVWRHRLAVLDIAQGELEEAAQLLRGLLDEGQDDPTLLYHAAYVDYARGDATTAERRLAVLMERKQLPRLPQVAELRLRCLHQLGAIDAGVEFFVEQIDRTASPTALGIASLMALDGQQIERARSWARRALDADPTQFEALVAQGTLALGDRDPDSALQMLEMARKAHPDDGRTLSAIGMALLLQMNLDRAREMLTQAVQAMPDHIGTWHGLGWCELMRKNVSAARTAFEAALALDPTFGESHGGLAVVQAMSQQVSAAEESIRRASKLDPTGLSARFAASILNGEVLDSEKFLRMARRVMGQRRTTDGSLLGDVISRNR